MRIITSLIFFALILSTCTPKIDYKQRQFEDLSSYGARKPEYALAGMTTAEGFSIQLFAAEPFLTNPTSIDIDHKGRVWVCESYNYDVSPEKEEKKGDRIVILEDKNGDGKADSRKVFYQGTDINVAIGIMLAGNKVYVSKSPNILVLEDTDGDDVADKKDTLFTDYSSGGDHSTHGMFLGPDGKFYFTQGNYAGGIKDKKGNQLFDKSGFEISNKGRPFWAAQVLRCNTDGSNLEVLGHNFRNNYEAALDSYGNIWTTDNDDDGNKSCRVNYVMEYGNYGYQDEITGAAWATDRTNIEKEIPDRHWHQNDPGSIPNLLLTGAGSPAGLTIYEGDLLPEKFKGQMIHTEPLYNVVRAYITQKSGAGFKAEISNINQGKDQWYRPVDVAVAPDGSLMVADWYDPGVGGGTAGDAVQGRIYRISYKKPKYNFKKPNFKTIEGNIEALQSPNISTRYIAFENLKKQGDAAIETLDKMWRSENPVFKARALWVLVQNKNIAQKYITEGLKDPNPNIRLASVKALRQTGLSQVALLSKLINDKSPEVRREIAISLRFCKEQGADGLWAELASQYDGKDRWYLEALGIASDLQAERFFSAWLNKVGNTWNEDKNRDIVWRVRSKDAIPLLAEIIKQTDTVNQALRYFRAFDFYKDDSKQQVLLSIMDSPKKEYTALALQHVDGKRLKGNPKLDKALEATLKDVSGTNAYLNLVERFELKNKKEEVLRLAIDNAEAPLGASAMNLLINFKENEFVESKLAKANDATSQAILAALKGNPYNEALEISKKVIFNSGKSWDVRKAAVKSLGSSWMGEGALLEAVKNPAFPDELKPTAGSILFSVYRTSIQREAEKYIPKPAAKGGKPLPPIHLLVNGTGDAVKGHTMFSKNCTQCHMAKQEGVKFGPELTQIGGKLSKEGFYKAILYPDEGVSHGFEGHTLKLKDGSMFVGIIGSETAGEIELRMQGGKSVKIPKSNIAENTENERSLMPSFAAAMTQEELTDLVEYLSTLK